jgi:hypothetical protein
MKKIVKKEKTKGRSKLDDKKLPNPKPTPSRTKPTSKVMANKKKEKYLKAVKSVGSALGIQVKPKSKYIKTMKKP